MPASCDNDDMGTVCGQGHGSNLKMRKMLIGYKQTRTRCDRDVWMNVDKDTDDIDVDMKINMT